MKNKIFNNKSEVLIAIGISMSVIGQYLTSNVFSIDFYDYTSMEYLKFSLAKIIKDIGTTLFTMTMIIHGLVRLRKKERNIKVFTLIVVPTTILMIFIAGCFISYKGNEKLFKSMPSKNETIKRLEKFEKNISSEELSPEKRKKSSYFIAQRKYFLLGKQTYYTDIDNKEVLYKPTKEELDQERKFQHSIELGKWTSKILKQGMIYNFIVLILSYLIAMIMPIKNMDIAK